MTTGPREKLALTGLSLASPQLWGAVRIVPLLRDSPIEDLRIDPECWNSTGVILLPDRSTYTAFIPHAFVVSWSHDGTPVATLGTQASGARGRRPSYFGLRFADRMVQRERRQGVAIPRLRFLPLHTAFEAYLALHFAGPDVLRREYSQQVLSHGLSPRVEHVTPGAWVPGLEAALRVFEILEDQVGVLIFVADALAAAFVVPHPDDYRRLHRTLLSDFYGELVYRYACIYKRSAPMLRPLRVERVESFEDLRLELARARADWTTFLHGMASGLFEQEVHLQDIYRLGRNYRLFRFLPEFRIKEENHIGELIRGPEGEVAYLKTFRLSEAQIRRGYLLNTLARHDWDLDASAEALNTYRGNLIQRIRDAGLGLLLRAHLRNRGDWSFFG